MNDVIFTKNLKVLITSDTTKQSYINLDIERSTEVRSNVFNIRLTDPDDYFFLFTCTINENEYHQLKNEQQLTIDYQTFSSVLIELLNECHTEEGKESPSKRLELHIQTLRSTLSIVEPRRIRNIIELKLYFTPADDAQQKAYLASSLKKYQRVTADRENMMKSQIDKLEQELEEKRNECKNLTSENDRLKNRQQLDLDELRNEFETKINIERENNINKIRDKSQQQEEQLKTNEENTKSKIRKLENKISELQRLNEEYHHQKTRAENTVREQKIRIDNIISEHNRMHTENEKNQLSRDELDRLNKSRMEKLSNLKAEIAAKTAEVTECRSNQTRLERQLQVSIDQKATLEEKFQRLQSQAQHLIADNSQLSNDLSKANEIIHRKIEEIKVLKDKYKRNTEIIKRQEDLLTKKDQDIKALGLKIKESENIKSKLESELETSRKDCTIAESDAAAAKEKIQQNDKVITYLNKQLNQFPNFKNENRLEGYIPIQNTQLTSTSTRGLYTSDSGIRLPKEQSTPINRINRSDENVKGGVSPVIADIQFNKGAQPNLPKPVNPLMPNKSNQNAHNISNRITSIGGVSGGIDNKYLTNTASTMPISAYFSSANGDKKD